jgi:hypothetical protein
MKQTIFVVIFAAFATIANPCSATQASDSGAVREFVPEYLGRLYTVVETPVMTGNKATVKAKLVDLICTLELARNATANLSGWVVEKLDCKKS